MNDTLLHVPFKFGTVSIWHSSHMGKLNDVFDLGNVYRQQSGKPSLLIASWVQRQDVTEYVELVSEQLGRPALERRRGKGGGTYAHLKILLDAAVSLSPEFKDEVYTIFINHRILQARDDSGEAYKAMSEAINISAERVLGKPAQKHHYINVAKAIRGRILGKDHPGWNMADAGQLHDRHLLEEKLISCLNNTLVRDWVHLIELANKL